MEQVALVQDAVHDKENTKGSRHGYYPQDASTIVEKSHLTKGSVYDYQHNQQQPP